MELEKGKKPSNGFEFVRALMRDELLKEQRQRWGRIPADRLNSLIASMTVEEKASLCSLNIKGETSGIPRLGIPSVQLPCGNEILPDFADWTYLKEVWNRDTVSQIADMIADKCAADRRSVSKVPFEGFPEGPALAGELACMFIDAIHAKGIGSILRFANESSDAASDELSTENDAVRSLLMVVIRSQPWVIYLSSAKEHKNISQLCYLAKRLKTECGLLGCTMFDSDNPADIERAFTSGIDMNLPVNNESNADLIIGLLRTGRITYKNIDDAAFRNLRVILMASSKD